MEAYACATSSNSTEDENISNMPRMSDKSIYPSDGVYYFEDGGTRLKAEVKNTPTQLRIRLIDDPPYFRDARLDRYMYRTPKKTLVYKKPKLMPNGLYLHQTSHALLQLIRPKGGGRVDEALHDHRKTRGTRRRHRSTEANGAQPGRTGASRRSINSENKVKEEPCQKQPKPKTRPPIRQLPDKIRTKPPLKRRSKNTPNRTRLRHQSRHQSSSRSTARSAKARVTAEFEATRQH